MVFLGTRLILSNQSSTVVVKPSTTSSVNTTVVTPGGLKPATVFTNATAQKPAIVKSITNTQSGSAKVVTNPPAGKYAVTPEVVQQGKLKVIFQIYKLYNVDLVQRLTLKKLTDFESTCVFFWS